MSTEREIGIIRFTCDYDGCHDNCESDAGDFADAWREARAMGWVNSHGEDGWQHFCPTCKRKLGD